MTTPDARLKAEQAIEAAKAEMSQFENQGEAHQRLGRALLAGGQYAEAAAAFETAERLDSSLPDIHSDWGDALSGAKSWHEAFVHYEAAAAARPEHSDAFSRLGHMLRESGENEKAADAYRRAAELGWRKAKATSPDDPSASARKLYLDLLRDCLTFLLWEADDGPLLELQPIRRPIETVAHLVRRLAVRIRPQSRSVREFGLDWPASALTMIGDIRLAHVQHCVEDALRRDVPGDLLEAGVWRGGVPIMMRAILRAYDVTDRVVWAADSFAGLPKPDPDKYPADRGFDLSMWKSLAVPLPKVKENFARFGLLDDQVKFLEGWFRDTLPTAPIDALAVMRLDGDLYESTMDGLVHLYPKLSPGGFAIIDDYYNAPPCKQAVDDYRSTHGIEEEIVTVDWSGAYWQKR